MNQRKSDQADAPGFKLDGTLQEALRFVRIVYTNHAGLTSIRKILPLDIRFGACDYHPGEQWLMEAYDIDKEATRTFAMKDIIKWL